MIAYIDHDTLPSSLPHDLTAMPEHEPTHSAQQSHTHPAHASAPSHTHPALEPPPISSPPSEDIAPPSPPSSPPSLPISVMDLPPSLVLPSMFNHDGSSIHSSSIILPSSPSPLSLPRPPVYRLSMYLDILSHWAEPRAKSIDFFKVSPRTNERYRQDRYCAGNTPVLVPTTYYQYKKRNRRKRITCQSESRIHPASIPS